MKKLIDLIISVFVSMHYATAQDIGKITKSDCFLKDCSLVDNGANIEFGYITVPEDYSDPNKKTYQLAFMIVKARNNNSKQDPILSFRGGWGAAASNDISISYHQKFTEDRDMIIYDFRGLGHSEPDLSTIKPAYDEAKRPDDPEESRKYTSRRINKILDALEDNNIDINMFGTDTNAKDGLLLAEILGYESYNLYGISNGSLVIQNFLRYAQNSTVKIRSAILDSNVPMGFPLHAENSKNFASSLNYILTDCANDSGCNENYPNLKARYKKFLQSLDVKPIDLKTAEGVSIQFDKYDANNMLFYMLYSRSLYAYIPLVIESMINKDKGAILKYYDFAGGDGSSISEVVNPIIYTYDQKLMRDKNRSLLETTIYEDEEFILETYLKDFYFTDTRIKQDSSSILPITTDVPSLILAGSFDPITPPLWSERIRSNFKNHFYFNIPKIGHGVTFQPCGTEIALAFLENPHKKPENTCEKELGKNTINFVSGYYKNLKIETLLTDLFTRNWFLIIGLAFVILTSLFSFVVGLIKIVRKKSTNIGNWITVNSFLILTTSIGLALIIVQTVEENPVLTILGLVNSANYILWLVPFIVIISVVLLIKLIKKESFKIIQKTALAGFILFCVIAINYTLYPNFL